MGIEFMILDWLQQLHGPVLDAFMIFVTTLGNSGMIWIGLTVLLLMIPKTRKTGCMLAVALCLDLILCNGFLKPLVARIRPYDIREGIQLLIEKPSDFSFPSGHTAASFCVAAALFFEGNKKLWIPAFCLAVLISFSRLYLYVHYPTDVLGGIIFGIAVGFISCKLINRWSSKTSKEL